MAIIPARAPLPSPSIHRLELPQVTSSLPTLALNPPRTSPLQRQPAGGYLPGRSPRKLESTAISFSASATAQMARTIPLIFLGLFRLLPMRPRLLIAASITSPQIDRD